jgi:hypothetical protein
MVVSAVAKSILSPNRAERKKSTFPQKSGREDGPISDLWYNPILGETWWVSKESHMAAVDPRAGGGLGMAVAGTAISGEGDDR